MENWKILCKKMWQLPPDSMKNLQEQTNYSLFGLKYAQDDYTRYFHS